MKTAEEIIRYDFLFDFDLGQEAIISEMMIAYADQFKPKWISIDEREPANGVDVLVYDIVSDSALVAKLDSDGYFTSCTHIYLEAHREVTHWMPIDPLPTKP